MISYKRGYTQSVSYTYHVFSKNISDVYTYIVCVFYRSTIPQNSHLLWPQPDNIKAKNFKAESLELINQRSMLITA